MVERLRHSAPNAARIVAALLLVLTLSCLFTAVRTYPYYFPYINALSFGRPGYALVNDSNLDWNQSLPEVKAFAEQHGLQSIDLDEYGFTDRYRRRAAVEDLGLPAARRRRMLDNGWRVSANMIMDGHNCIWLMQYAHATTSWRQHVCGSLARPYS